VLSAPPAFVLSQDQTLREEVKHRDPRASSIRRRIFRHLELVLKVARPKSS